MYTRVKKKATHGQFYLTLTWTCKINLEYISQFKIRTFGNVAYITIYERTLLINYIYKQYFLVKFSIYQIKKFPCYSNITELIESIICLEQMTYAIMDADKSQEKTHTHIMYSLLSKNHVSHTTA